MIGIVAALGLALASPVGAEPAGSRPLEISILSYNTHGLAAWVAGDDPLARFPRIAEQANRFDVVLLQEDFAHHERLVPRVVHEVVERGNPSRFAGSWLCPVCGGSGLTLLMRWRDALESLTNVAYDACHGWLRHANDCLATKGFQHARLRLPGGGTLDLVNTHLDAGREPGDREARRVQLAALRAHLERAAAGRALVLAGDLNLDAADPEDVIDRDAFATALGLRDSGAGAAPGSSWQRLDYVYLRDGAGLGLQVLDAGEDPDFRHAGLPLSDHPALFLDLRLHRKADGADGDVPSKVK